MEEPAAPPHVLVIEDDETMAVALDYLLRREGCIPERLDTRSDGVERVRAARPPLVLLDTKPAAKSGYRLCHEVRRDAGLRGTKILLMTARGSARERRKGIEAGVDGFLAKPFEPNELRSELKRLLWS